MDNDTLMQQIIGGNERFEIKEISWYREYRWLKSFKYIIAGEKQLVTSLNIFTIP